MPIERLSGIAIKKYNVFHVFHFMMVCPWYIICGVSVIHINIYNQA
jgi:hypothetical protein